ncbi:MAG: hypothetical protein IJ159_00685 [Prevotella sp.]|nr:hypothetical protein [Prevotella sp.]
MKKYLIVGALALVTGLFVTSCNHEDDFGGEDLATQKTEAFQKAFVSAFGQINANQNWGFYDEDLASITAAATRAAARTRSVDVNSNEWEAKGYTIPSAITEREYEVVMNYFRTTPNPQSETVDIHNYFIQNVGYTDHTYYAYYKKDGRTETVTITNPGSTYMNWIFCGPGAQATAWNDPTPVAYTWNDGDEHINDFNAGSGQIQHILYTGSEYFGFNESYGTDHQEGKSEHKYGTKNRNFTIRFIDVDGEVGCYVGFNYESGKTNEEGWHLDPDEYFDDRVIKLVAAEGVITPPEPVKTKEERDRTFSTWGTPGRVLCEDLGNVSYNDIDYNDVVFDAQIEHRVVKHYVDWYYDGEFHHTDETTKSDNYYAHITLLAAGGTMPLTVAGVEVHNAFGVGVATMVNTVTEHNQNINGSYVTREYVDLGEFEGYESINEIPVIVNYSSTTGGAAVELETTPGKAPHKLLVLADYEDEDGNTVKGTDWPCERANLGDAYPGFKQYVASPKQNDETGEFVYDENGNLVFEGGKDYAGEKFWEDGSDSEYLFHSWVSANSGEARYTTTTKDEKTDDGRTIYVVYYEEGNGYDISTPLYFTNNTQLTDLNITANDVIRIYGTAADPTNWRIALTNGNSKAVATVGTSQGNWTGYVDIILTTEMVNKLKEGSNMAAMIISGTGIVLTEVDLIKAK